jgi:hypothetical protein
MRSALLLLAIALLLAAAASAQTTVAYLEAGGNVDYGSFNIDATWAHGHGIRLGLLVDPELLCDYDTDDCLEPDEEADPLALVLMGHRLFGHGAFQPELAVGGVVGGWLSDVGERGSAYGYLTTTVGARLNVGRVVIRAGWTPRFRLTDTDWDRVGVSVGWRLLDW